MGTLSLILLGARLTRQIAGEHLSRALAAALLTTGARSDRTRGNPPLVAADRP